jgi:hypothetical protein
MFGMTCPAVPPPVRTIFFTGIPPEEAFVGNTFLFNIKRSEGKCNEPETGSEKQTEPGQSENEEETDERMNGR